MVSGSRALVEDFDKGQEVLISRYDLQGNPEGLQVQLDLQQGHAQVQAVIDQEVSLVKHNLLATRLTDRPNAPAPGRTCNTQSMLCMSAVCCRLDCVIKFHQVSQSECRQAWHMAPCPYQGVVHPACWQCPSTQAQHTVPRFGKQQIELAMVSWLHSVSKN